MAKLNNKKDTIIAYFNISMMIFVIILVVLEYGFGIHIGL